MSSDKWGKDEPREMKVWRIMKKLLMIQSKPPETMIELAHLS